MKLAPRLFAPARPLGSFESGRKTSIGSGRGGRPVYYNPFRSRDRPLRPRVNPNVDFCFVVVFRVLPESRKPSPTGRLRWARPRRSEAGKSTRSMSPSPLGCPEGPPASDEPPASSTPVGQVGEGRAFSNIPPTDDGPNDPVEEAPRPKKSRTIASVACRNTRVNWERVRRIDSVLLPGYELVFCGRSLRS